MLERLCRKGNPPIPVDGDVNWCNHYGEQYGGPLKKLKIEIPYDPAISLLDIYLEKMKALIRKDTFIPQLIATQFTIADMNTP